MHQGHPRCPVQATSDISPHRPVSLQTIPAAMLLRQSAKVPPPPRAPVDDISGIGVLTLVRRESGSLHPVNGPLTPRKTWKSPTTAYGSMGALTLAITVIPTPPPQKPPNMRYTDTLLSQAMPERCCKLANWARNYSSASTRMKQSSTTKGPRS